MARNYAAFLFPRKGGGTRDVLPDESSHANSEQKILRWYMAIAGSAPLLTREQEAEFSKKIGQLKQDYEQIQRKLEKVEPDRRSDTARTLGEESAYTALREAVGDLASHNFRLVIKIARGIMRLRPNRGLTLLDLIQDGNEGLLKSCEKFDYNLGFRFSTYGQWWIRHAIYRAIDDKSRNVSIPMHLLDLRPRWRRAMHRLHIHFEREPTNAEIAEEMKISVEKSEILRSVNAPELSLERSIGGPDFTLEDILASQTSLDAFNEAADAELTDSLMRVLGELKPREQYVIEQRFGLGCDVQTLEEIGRELKLSRERIRQIEQKALEKLRHPSCRKKLQTLRSA